MDHEIEDAGRGDFAVVDLDLVGLRVERRGGEEETKGGDEPGERLHGGWRRMVALL